MNWFQVKLRYANLNFSYGEGGHAGFRIAEFEFHGARAWAGGEAGGERWEAEKRKGGSPLA